VSPAIRRSARGAAVRGHTVRLGLHLQANVVRQALDDIHRHPDIEVGGKFIGYVDGGFQAAARDWRRQLDDLQVHVVAYLDAGPQKQRSAVQHLSDTDYQFRLYQEVIRDHPDVTFLGLWHSHHPNGLSTLSHGDEQTGTVTVNNPGHELDFLLSSLAVDFDGLQAGRHFVFVRGHTGVLEIDPSRVRIVEGPNEVAQAVAVAAARLHAEYRSGSQIQGSQIQGSQIKGSQIRGYEDGAGESGSGAASRAAGGSASGNRSTVSPTSTGQTGSGSAAKWMATEWGKQVITDDKEWLRAHPGVRPFLRDGNLVWQGPMTAAGLAAHCELKYPAGFPDDPPVVVLRTDDDAFSVRFTVPDATRRREGFQTAVRAFSVLLAAGEAIEPPVTAAIADGEDDVALVGHGHEGDRPIRGPRSSRTAVQESDGRPESACC